jgi:hypothetical protein
VGQVWTATSGDGLRANCQTTGCFGLYGLTSAADLNATGPKGFVNSLTSKAAGVFGRSNSTDADAAGVFGQIGSSGYTGSGKAVWGFAYGTGYAIYGSAVDSATKAGQFDGAVQVNGNLSVNGTVSKTAGSFKIDHPLDPANCYLSHSFVESPDVMNVYNGNAVLDASGQAWVTLPPYFEALNVEYRYQLTQIGGAAPNLHVAQEIHGNQFLIGGGTSGLKVSWQVTGIRNDPYAQQHRIPVEEAKPAAERGTYVYPQGYGQPARQPAAAPFAASPFTGEPGSGRGH